MQERGLSDVEDADLSSLAPTEETLLSEGVAKRRRPAFMADEFCMYIRTYERQGHVIVWGSRHNIPLTILLLVGIRVSHKYKFLKQSGLP